jgi:membrane protein
VGRVRVPRLDRVPPFARRVAARVVADDVATHAAAMTYATFLAIPPLLLLALSVVGFVLAGDEEARRAVADAVVDTVPGLRSGFGDWLESVVTGRVTLGLLALPAVLWTATGVFARARHALARVFTGTDQGLLLGRLHGLVVQVPLGAGVVVLAGLNGLVSGLGHSGVLGAGAEALAYLALLLLDVAFLSLAYRLLTPGVRLAEHLPGAAVFAVAWAVLHRLSAAAVPTGLDARSALYGTLGVVFGLLAFLYATSWVFLVSAELSQVLRERRQRT